MQGINLASFNNRTRFMLIAKTPYDRPVCEKTHTEQRLAVGIQNALPQIFRHRSGLKFHDGFGDVIYEFRNSSLMSLVAESIGITGGSYQHLNRDDFSDAFNAAIGTFFASVIDPLNNQLSALLKDFVAIDYRSIGVNKYTPPELTLQDMAVMPPRREAPIVLPVGTAAIKTYETGVSVSRQAWESIGTELLTLIASTAIDVVKHDKELIANLLQSSPEVNNVPVFDANNSQSKVLNLDSLDYANGVIGGGSRVLLTSSDLLFTANQLNHSIGDKITVIELPELSNGNWYLTTHSADSPAVYRVLLEGNEKPVVLYHRSKSDDRSEIYFRREVDFLITTRGIFNGKP